MTVQTELSRATFPWTGVETLFSCGFPADKIADVSVFFRTPAGVISELLAGVNHTVVLAGGTKLVSIVPIALPPAPGTIVVSRTTPALVSEVLLDGVGFSLAIIQQLHDRAAMRSAEDRTRFSRAIVLAEGAELGAGNFDLGGSGLDNLAPGMTPNSAATIAQMQAILVGTGNVPPPLPADIGLPLMALAGGLFGWGPFGSGAFSTDPVELEAIRVLLSVAHARPGDKVVSYSKIAPPRTLKANGAAVNRTVYADLDAAIYCGDAENALADWGFRCTNPANPTGTRSTTGGYVVLPDPRGKFARAWDDGRGIDAGRNFWRDQAEAFKQHNHATTEAPHGHSWNMGIWGYNASLNVQQGTGAYTFSLQTATPSTSLTGLTIQNSGGVETRPVNTTEYVYVRY